jgi:hypothetical protein
MNQRGVILVIVALTAGLAVVAGRAARGKRAAETERHSLTQRRAELMLRLRTSETELAATPRAASPATTVATVATEPSVAAPASSEPRAANSLLEWLEDPKAQVLHLAHERATLAVSYGPFFQAQRLSSGQIERLSDLIVRSRAYQHDLSELHRLKGRDFNEPEMLAQRDRDKAEIEAGMTAVLGEAGYALLKDYVRSLEVRVHIGDFAGAAAVEGIPINRETADALVELLASSTPLYSLGGKAERSRIDWKKVEGDAAKLLTPAQMKLYQQNGGKGGAARKSDALWDALQRAKGELRKTAKPVAR